jgi:hypothetical protein
MERKGAGPMNGEELEHSDKWAVGTFGAAELGYLRRTDRLVKMVAAIAENPSASLPESMRNWIETLAAYRFLDNEAMDGNLQWWCGGRSSIASETL